MLLDSETQTMSRTDIVAQELVEPRVKIKNGHFEIPVPLKLDFKLPNNFGLASDRVSAIKKKALKQLDLCEFSAESGREWYLPYFVTSQVKKRIVYDGKSEWQGRCVNDVLMSGPDLLNPLVHLLTRFRRGKFGLMADVTMCFFQIALPESQRDLFRILWFENDNIDTGKIVPYRFVCIPGA